MSTTDRGNGQLRLQQLSRRKLLLLFAGGAGAALAACAPSAPPAGPTAQKPAAGPGAGATSAPAAAPTAAGGASQSTGSGAQELVVALQDAGVSNDPARSTAISDWAVVEAVYSGLLRYKPGGYELEPDLAESWDVSQDGKEYTFKLKKGVEFHQGFGEVTADDVKFTIERQLDPNFKGLTRSNLWMVDHLDAIDKYTAKFVLKQPFSPFPSVIALGRPQVGAIVSKAAAEKLGNDNYSEHPIGSGPFVFESQIPNQSQSFRANPRYHLGPPKVGGLKMLNMPDETTVGLAIEKGEVHVGNIRSADLVQKYRDTPRTQVLIGDRFTMVYVTLNTSLKPLDDVNVRRALAQGVSAATVVEGVLAGLAEVMTAGLVHPKMLGFNPSIKPWTTDPEQARRLLAQAGASGLSTAAVTYTGSEWTTVGALIQQELAKIGVNFKFEQLERATLTQRRGSPQNPMVIISATTGPDPDTLLSYFETGQLPPSGLNFSWYTAADELIKQSRVETDQAKRASVIQQIQTKLAEDVPVIPLYYNKNLVMVSKTVKNYQLDVFGGHWLAQVSLG